MAFYSPLMNVMTAAARKAAVRLKRDYGEVDQLQVSRKGPADFVSAADLRTEEILHTELKRARPNFGFLMEERGEEIGADPTRRWIIDPLDGTTNFLHGLPQFAISIALEEMGEISAGLVYAPITEEMFWAERGAGAHLENRRLRVSARGEMNQSIFATGIPFLGRGDHEHFTRELNAVMDVSAGIRRFGAASLDLAYVAAGRFDGYWERDLHAWDLAAGLLLVREAGGYVSEIEGGSDMLQSGSVLAANDHLHKPLGDLLRAQKA